MSTDDKIIATKNVNTISTNGFVILTLNLYGS